MTKEFNDYYMIKPSDDSLIIYPKILFSEPGGVYETTAA